MTFLGFFFCCCPSRRLIKWIKINIKSIIKKTYEVGGLKHFYSGFSFAIARAILLHSGTFAMMEILNSM